MPKRLKDIRFIDQRALTLILDIALLLQESKEAEDSFLETVFARSAIANAALLLECVANSCLGSLGLPSRLLDDLDRLPTLSKFDYYLSSRSGNHINRGCRETEVAQDVLKLRDHIVHPKQKPGLIVEAREQPQVDYGSSKALGISLDNRSWKHQGGLKVATAVNKFLCIFFLDWCGHDKGDVTRVLACRERDLLNCELAMWVTLGLEEHQILQKWLPDTLSFLDLRFAPIKP